jgi:NAD(P)-dependent dehydrogenase (short-subunit alcohol dehydrogenase family)
MNRVDGKIALVTGAARGLGAATAHALASGGAHVVVTDILDDAGQSTAAEIGKSGGSAEYVHLDVTQEAQWKAVVEGVCARHGGLDILVNNAGIEIIKPLANTSLDDWRRITAINVDGVFLGTKLGIWAMTEGSTRRSKGGSVVNVASAAGLVGAAAASAYCMTKGAVRLFSKAAAIECGRTGNGVRVNCVCPGGIATTLLDDGLRNWLAAGVGATLDETRAIFTSMHPIGRLGAPEDIGNAVCFLASDASSFMTGADLVVDGGWTAA